MNNSEKMENPAFLTPNFDHRNIEDAGHYRGAGEAGKMGLKNCSSYDPMPTKKHCVIVSRDHESAKF